MHLPTLFLLLFWLSGYSTAGNPLTGPGAARGPERGSLTVQCRYDPGWETHRKWWCRGARWSRCKMLVETTGSEQEVRKGHVSIRDNQKNHTFTVTMEGLRRDDADTYWCGIKRTGADHGVQVEVTVDPAPATVSTAAPTTNMFTALATLEKTDCSPTLTSYHFDNGHGVMRLSVLLPLVFAILLLLSVAVSLLAWRMVKRQKKAGVPPAQVSQPLEDELFYANLTLQRTGTSPSSSRKKASMKASSSAQKEVEYVTMAPFPREEVSYTSLTLGNLDQEPTYSNTSQLITHIPGTSHGDPTEYSTLRRP
ncbi:PREDICTED: CMRF35-like molecule 1 isoform X2 [Propithecus coquereli]|uniref:CMRF35-like molecule 1 isoform X2 n=1 Tax=Propithecus coquereli TaxID=379532 RepID=UPI00063FB77E|nr:PREDICTED: CMRF35-like molecule 1 isoform X2 [Propithecus coquereli]